MEKVEIWFEVARELWIAIIQFKVLRMPPINSNGLYYIELWFDYHKIYVKTKKSHLGNDVKILDSVGSEVKR